MSSGRYHSKLFNFVDQQSRRLTKKMADGLQHIQIVTKWNIEVLLHSLFRLLPSSESEQKICSGKDVKSLSQAASQLDVKTPIPTDLPGKHLHEGGESLPLDLDIDVRQPTTDIASSVNKTELAFLPYPARMLIYVDSAIAKLEASALIPIEQCNLNINISIETLLNYFFGLTRVNTSHQQTLYVSQPTANKARFEDYSSLLPYQEKLQPPRLIDNEWLAWNDLFDELQVNSNEPRTEPKTEPRTFTVETYPVSYYHSWREKAKSLWKSFRLNQGIAPQKLFNFDFNPQFEDEANNWKSTQKKYHLNNLINEQPDWIEINARFLGYEQHPMQRILMLLDRLLLVLEKFFRNAYFFFKGLFAH